MATGFKTDFSNRRVLITGGLGFIGSNLARRLVELGAQVALVDLLVPEHGGNWYNIDGIESQVAVTIADVRDEPQMVPLVRGCEFLFNLAGQSSHADSMHDPQRDLEFNTASPLAVLELCRRENPTVRIVYAGTRQVYGPPRYLPVDEEHPLNPPDFNGANKMAAEWHHAIAHRVYGLRTTTLRLTNVYGPRMRVRDTRQNFIGWWFHELIEGEEILVYGDGAQIRDLNYVDDVVEALLLTASSAAAEGQVYNLGGDDPVSLIDLARMMVSINGEGGFRLTDFPAEVKRINIGSYTGDYRRIKAQLGWQPKILLKEGLTRTLEFYRQNKERYW